MYYKWKECEYNDNVVGRRLNGRLLVLRRVRK